MRLTELQVLSTIKDNDKFDSYNFKYLLNRLPNWRKYVFSRHVVFVNDYLSGMELGQIAKKHKLEMSGILQVFLRIEKTLELTLKLGLNKLESNVSSSNKNNTRTEDTTSKIEIIQGIKKELEQEIRRDLEVKIRKELEHKIRVELESKIKKDLENKLAKQLEDKINSKANKKEKVKKERKPGKPSANKIRLLELIDVNPDWRHLVSDLQRDMVESVLQGRNDTDTAKLLGISYYTVYEKLYRRESKKLSKSVLEILEKRN